MATLPTSWASETGRSRAQIPNSDITDTVESERILESEKETEGKTKSKEQRHRGQEWGSIHHHPCTHSHTKETGRHQGWAREGDRPRAGVRQRGEQSGGESHLLKSDSFLRTPLPNLATAEETNRSASVSCKGRCPRASVNTRSAALAGWMHANS